MTGEQEDIARRIKIALPSRWFSDKTPVLDVVLRGTSAVLSGIYERIFWVAKQVRLRSADSTCLDALVSDYLGSKCIRRSYEDDASFRARAGRELLRERSTRRAIVTALEDLTGRRPTVFEPRRPFDTGAYANANMPAPTALAYGLRGGWGSLNHPFQCFITAYRPLGTGTAPGFGWGNGGYNTGRIAYADQSILKGRVSDDDIMASVHTNLPLGSVAWLRIDS